MKTQVCTSVNFYTSWLIHLCILVLQLANLLCQASLGRNHNQNIQQTFTYPQLSNPTPTPHQPSSPLRAQGEDAVMPPPPDYSEFDELRPPPSGTLHGNALSPSYPMSRAITPGLDRGKNARHITTPTASSSSVRATPPLSSHSTPMGSRSKKSDWSVNYNPRVTPTPSQPSCSVTSMPPSSKLSPPSSHCTADYNSQSRSVRPDWSVEYNPGPDRTLEVNLVRTITNGQGAFRIKFSPNGQLLAVVACKGQIVTIYNVATGAKVW